MTFDTEKFLEQIEENRPLVIILAEGIISEVYIPEGEMSPEYLSIDTDNITDETDRDSVVEILESIGYNSATPVDLSSYWEELSVCSCEA